MRFRKWVCGEEEGYRFFCPGCQEPHSIRTKGQTVWGVSGEMDYLTFTPSLLVHMPDPDNPRVDLKRCHSYIREGLIQFLSDCSHGLKGRTIDIPDWPSDWNAGGAIDE